MPSYNSAERSKPVKQRVSGLIKSAENTVKEIVISRSWTEWGYDWLTYTGNGIKIVGTFVIQTAINFYGGKVVEGALSIAPSYAGKSMDYVFSSLIGPIGKYLEAEEIKRISEETIGATLTEMSGGTINDYLCGLIEVDENSPASIGEKLHLIKPKKPRAAIGVAKGQNAISQSASDAINESIRMEGLQDTHKPKELLDDMEKRMAELVVLLTQFGNKALKSEFKYCDDVYYLSLDLYNIDAARTKVYEDILELQTYLANMKLLVEGVKAEKLKTDILTPLVRKIVGDPDIPHANHYSFNIVSRAASCSVEHCYGPKPH